MLWIVLQYSPYMRLRTFVASAGVLFILGLLGFRIIDLEQRVGLLSRQLSRLEPVGTIDAGNEPKPASTTDRTPSVAFERRLKSLEKRVEALASRPTLLPSGTGDFGTDVLRSEEAILSVVEREASRIRDVQLEYHKARWLETRQQQLAGFASQLKLEPAQTTELYSALENELDRMADVMRRPNIAEDPDQLASDWQQILVDTDERAKAVLTPEQYQFWAQGRFVERKVLWNWLPATPPETAQR